MLKGQWPARRGLRSVENEPFFGSVNEAFETTSGLVREELAELLARFGAPSTTPMADGPPERGRWIMSSIGCSGHEARGALTLVASPAFWRAIADRSSGASSDAMLSDLAGEMANMLMGRVRNRLLALGLEIHQATPTCAFGDAIVLSDPGDAHTRWLSFVTRGGAVHARLDAFFSPDLVLSTASERAVQACDTELVLF